MLQPPQSLLYTLPQTEQGFPESMRQSLNSCLRSLAFPSMQSRSFDIDRAATGTCQWLLQHQSYKSWTACDQGLLWIKGKPGAGKSTLLKYALENYNAEEGDLVLFP